jgi:predicted aspartyl protease
MIISYNKLYTPPIPVLPIRFYSPVTDIFVGPFDALIDTGADATLLPRSILREIGAEETSPGWLRGVTGERRPVALYFVDIYLENQSYPGIRVMADVKGQEIILGRDVLNKISLFLDGRQQQTIILDEAMTTRLRRQK